jgi:hypothetical protein
MIGNRRGICYFAFPTPILSVSFVIDQWAAYHANVIMNISTLISISSGGAWRWCWWYLTGFGVGALGRFFKVIPPFDFFLGAGRIGPRMGRDTKMERT